LSDFLADTTLSSSLDQSIDEQDTLSLMTLHNGKGLEFENAFLVGLEEDLLPHINSKKNEEQIEEERRLFYVGITRAKKRLFISCAQMRGLWGSTRHMRPSRFLQEIPQNLRQIVSNVSVNQPVVTSYQKPAAPHEVIIFSVGEHVFHPEFGVGKIENASEGSLGLMYDVYFSKDASVKRLVAKFAPLSPLAAK